MNQAPLPIEERLNSEALAAAVLGAGLPSETETHLRKAGLAYQREEVAEHDLTRAWVLAPEHTAVLIAFYRYYFYNGRLKEALEIARARLEKAAREIGLSSDWRRTLREDAEFESYDAVLPRFYLFTLKGFAYLQMRLGNLDEGRCAAAKLLELDPSDKVGAKVLLEVLERNGGRDDD